ncbi:MAG: aminotransferase class I/II-fold pyridoxal phosphate-dependent enzyme [Clostridiales bacterium]|jgi:lysine decarboxylase|nr:aminotransferase class I/II-fold pyridoxal phosphate-dependent enzyme [Clostridiales bacterium]
MKLKTPIADGVTEYIKARPVRFHTPGHQGVFKDGIFKGSDADITELSFSDNLLFSDGIIRQSENQAAELYGTQGTLFFTNGATAAVFTAVSALAVRGAYIAVGANCHRSVFSAAAVCGLKPVFYDTADDGGGYLLPANADSIERLLKAFYDAAISGAEGIERSLKNSAANSAKKISAVVVTSPDYFGKCAEIKEIYKVTQKYGVRLIIDAAHGAHFRYSALLPDAAVGCADYVIEGCHKTMPVYTGGALLHCNGSKLRLDAELKRAVFHSTSPQYITLASIDYAIAELNDNGEGLYRTLAARTEKFYKQAADAGFFIKNQDGANCDFSRLVISCGEYSGAELCGELEKKNIFAETAYGNRAVFILSPYNVGALDNLADALKGIRLSRKAERIDFPPRSGCVADADGVGNGIEYVSIDDILGRTAASEIGVYPPGTPAVLRGEAITAAAFGYLSKHKDRLFGLIEGKVGVIKGG